MLKMLTCPYSAIFILMYMGKKLIQNFVILLHDIRKIAKKGNKVDSFGCTSPLVYKVN
jgi:hypothetical protein